MGRRLLASLAWVAGDGDTLTGEGPRVEPSGVVTPNPGECPGASSALAL